MEFLPPGIEVHDQLNPNLWNGKRLNNLVKNKLIKIAHHFQQFVDIDFPVIDIIITGGQTSRYYTKYSDLDLHLITDYDKIECDRELEELFDTKKLLYKEKYDITVKGIPVELYVEDVKQYGAGGSYSLLKNKWIRPSTEPKKSIDKNEVDSIAKQWYKIIMKVIKSNDIESLEKVLNNLKLFRKKGLEIQGEYGSANLAFKSLRNSGIIDKLRKNIIQHRNQELGLK